MTGRRNVMSFSDEIRNIRQSCFLSQDSFAKALDASFSTINRWETGKTVPNCMMMGKIAQFCKENGISYQAADKAWKECRNGSGSKE